MFSSGNILIHNYWSKYLESYTEKICFGQPFSWILFACTHESWQMYFPNNVSWLDMEEQQQAKENVKCLLCSKLPSVTVDKAKQNETKSPTDSNGIKSLDQNNNWSWYRWKPLGKRDLSQAHMWIRPLLLLVNRGHEQKLLLAKGQSFTKQQYVLKISGV